MFAVSEKIKRARYLFFHYQEKPVIDMERFLQGEAEIISDTKVYVASVLTREEYCLTTEEFELISNIPQFIWTDKKEAIEQNNTDNDVIDDLVKRGLLISDSESEPAKQLREAEKNMTSTRWYKYSLLYHYMSKWDGRKNEEDEKSAEENKELPEQQDPNIDDIIKARGGLPPHHFYTYPNNKGIIDLPLDNMQDEFTNRVMHNRRTVRQFDQSKPLSLAVYSKILFNVFGCHGTLPFEGHKDITIVKKTSPSGGSMHPVDAYPVVTNVSGLNPGIYHYNMQHHKLELIQPLDREEAINLVTKLTAGQDYFGNAHVSTILIARFYRNFWKYAYHKKAYKVILMDGAHLSQSHYMLCTHLGLGAYYTAAMDDMSIEEDFGLDGTEHGVVGVCGCGISMPTLDPELNFTPTPYSPSQE